MSTHTKQDGENEMEGRVHSSSHRIIANHCKCFGFPLPSIRASNNILAINPTIIASAVTAITHFGSFPESVSPSVVAYSLHRSAHPDNASSVNTGPNAPHKRGVMLAQYNSHRRCFLLPE